MVRLATLAVLFLSATVLARPTHKRRSVCKTGKPASATTTLAAVDYDDSNDNKNVEAKPSSTKMVKVTTKSAAPSKTADPKDDSGSSDSGDDDGGVISGGSGSLTALLPMGAGKSSWSLAKGSGAHQVEALTANTLIRKKEASTSKHPVVQWQGKTALEANMVKGCLTPGSSPACGMSFYSPGISGSNVDLSKAKDMTFSYSIYFDEGFDWQLGGKLPGLYGGTTKTAETCSGGRHDKGCWSARFMFRPDANGELYLYVPPGVNSNDSKCGKAAGSKCAGDYGASAGRGTWKWATGKWQTISQRIHLGTVGKDDGFAEVYYNGKRVLRVDKITWMVEQDAVARGAMIQTFFGGHTDEWRSPKNQKIHFADFSVAILA